MCRRSSFFTVLNGRTRSICSLELDKNAKCSFFVSLQTPCVCPFHAFVVKYYRTCILRLCSALSFCNDDIFSAYDCNTKLKQNTSVDNMTYYMSILYYTCWASCSCWCTDSEAVPGLKQFPTHLPFVTYKYLKYCCNFPEKLDLGYFPHDATNIL